MLCETTTSSEKFIEVIKIFICKPHIINRRLCDAIEIYHGNFEKLNDSVNKINCLELEGEKKALFSDISIISKLVQLQDAKSLKGPNKVEVYFHKLLPKNANGNNCENVISIIDHSTCEAFFISEENEGNLCPRFPYSIYLSSGKIQLNSFYADDEKTLQWLQNHVLPKLIKWTENTMDEKRSTLCTQSLCLIPTEKYYQKYNNLKTKYGLHMVKVWPEKTDPTKFVYEDIAIATYLLILWEEERLQKSEDTLQSFVDLGCGNGLLVYILSKEGHPGYGIDVRKRGIWDMFSDDIKLQVDTVVPSQDFLFPQTDWLIGNHSDELTPWIPVMAAKSSYNCKFFLLPCCSYEFNGSKYQRNNSSKSLYRDYLEYILNICKVCGIQTQVDRLRIPSTKRICLVGQSRTYAYGNYEESKKQIQQFIDTRCDQSRSHTIDDNSKLWVSTFKPRDGIEKVRNCTQLRKSVIEGVVDLVAKALLESNTNSNENIWNAGASLDLKTIVSSISPEALKQLKSECGGLQTLLRNNHHIFEVNNGKVSLRYPRTIEQVQKCALQKQRSDRIVIKQKPCWFHLNHPNGCPLENDVCSFSH